MARPTPLLVVSSFWVLSLWVALVGLGTPSALAHEIGLSKGDYQIDGAEIRTELTFARGELASSIEGLDADRNGRLEAADLETGRPLVLRQVIDALQIQGDSKRCPGRLEDLALVEEDGITVRARYTCDAEPEELAFDLSAMLEGLSKGHRHVAFTATDRISIEHITFRDQATFRVFTERSPSDDRRQAGGEGARLLEIAGRGLLHVVLGIVHVAFLAALLLVADRARSFATMLGAFVVGQSVTLLLVVLGVVAIPERVVEAATALSLTYVAVENWFLRHPERRWRIALPFGALHGFGMAGAFQVAPSASPDVIEIGGYYAGVEAGVAAIALLCVPMIVFARRSLAFRDTGIKVLSAGIGLAGLVWFALAVAR